MQGDDYAGGIAYGTLPLWKKLAAFAHLDEMVVGFDRHHTMSAKLWFTMPSDGHSGYEFKTTPQGVYRSRTRPPTCLRVERVLQSIAVFEGMENDEGERE